MTTVGHEARGRALRRSPGCARPKVGRPQSRPAPSAPAGLRRPPGRCLPPEPPPLRWRTTRSLAEHRRVRRRSLAAAVLLAVLVAAVVVGFGSVARPPAAELRGSVLVQVRQGESLTEIARRVAPGVDTRVVVDRIRDRNRLPTAALHPGQVVEVPVPG